MITASAQLAVTIEGRTDPVADVRVGIDLPDTTYPDFSTNMRSLSLSVQNGTDLPQEVRDVTGFSTLGGDLVLSGMLVEPSGVLDGSKTVVWLFDPDSTTSTLYRQRIKGAKVTVDIGYYLDPALTPSVNPEWVRKFTGVIATADVDHTAGTVTLHLVDMSSQWDDLPLISVPVTAPPFNAGMTSEYVIDAVIRSSARPSTWPATWPRALLATGMRSSLWPEAGQVGNLAAVSPGAVPIFAPGKFGSALVGVYPGLGLGLVPYTMAGPVNPGGSAVYLECFAAAGTGAGEGVSVAVQDFPGAPSCYVKAQYVHGQLSATIADGLGGVDTFTHTLTTDTAVHYIAAAFTWSGTTWSVQLRLDGTTYSSGTRTVAFTRPATPLPYAAVTVAGQCSIEALQVTAYIPAGFNDTFAPAAVIDASLNPLTVVPEIPAGSKGSDVIQQIAGAEFGYARWDEAGVFRFTNRNTIANAGIVRQIASANALRPGITTTIGAATEYDHVQVPFTEWRFGAAGVLFTLDAVKKLPPGTTSWTQPLTGPGAVFATTAAELPNAHDPADGGTWFRASADPDGLHRHNAVAVFITQLSAQTVRIDAVNNSAATAYLTTPGDTYTDFAAGSAGSGLWIGGVPATASDEAFSDSTYGAGTKPALTVSSNPYIQSQPVAQALGDWLLPQLIYAVRDYTGVAFDIDPRLQLPDQVQIVDPDESGISEYVQVWGWQLSIDFPPAGQSGGGWDQSLDCRALGPPGAWLLGIPGRSELDDGTGLVGTAYLYA